VLKLHNMKQEQVKEIEKALATEVSDRHSFFQLRHYVIGKEPTLQSKLWRCLRELKARKESIEAIKLETDETKDQIDMAQVEIDASDSLPCLNCFGIQLQGNEEAVANAKRVIQRRQLCRKKKGLENNLQALEIKQVNLEQEAIFFLDAFNELGGKDKLKPFDDAASQEEYWNSKLSQELELKVLMGLPVDTDLMKTILALHDSSPLKISTIKSLKDRAEKMRALDSASRTKCLPE
jgi:hypothetical protein